MLTYKCKEAFIYWFASDFITKSNADFLWMYNYKISFIDLDFSMQYGVYVDFFDSVGIDIDEIFEGELFLILTRNNGDGGKKEFRKEAQEQAILKANEIFNNKTH